LQDATKDFEQLTAKDLPALNEALKAKGKEPVPTPLAKVAVNDNDAGSSNLATRSNDPDAPLGKALLPANFRLLH
jgi:hypothetical protein